MLERALKLLTTVWRDVVDATASARESWTPVFAMTLSRTRSQLMAKVVLLRIIKRYWSRTRCTFTCANCGETDRPIDGETLNTILIRFYFTKP